jgi:two-component system, NtrC family, response regulator HydG
LISHYAHQFARKYGRPPLTIPNGTISRLQEYRWSGNVRELKHAVERAVIMSENGSFPLDDIVFSAAPSAAAIGDTTTLNLDELEKLAIQQAIQRYQGNLSRAAQALGLGRTTLYRKMARHGL